MDTVENLFKSYFGVSPGRIPDRARTDSKGLASSAIHGQTYYLNIPLRAWDVFTLVEADQHRRRGNFVGNKVVADLCARKNMPDRADFLASLFKQTTGRGILPLLFADPSIRGVRLSHTHGVTNLEVDHEDEGWRVTNLKPTRTYVEWVSSAETSRVIAGNNWVVSSVINPKSTHVVFSRKENKEE